MGKKEEMNLVEEQSMHMPIRRGNQHLKPSSLQKRDVVVIVDSLCCYTSTSLTDTMEHIPKTLPEMDQNVLITTGLHDTLAKNQTISVFEACFRELLVGKIRPTGLPHGSSNLKLLQCTSSCLSDRSSFQRQIEDPGKYIDEALTPSPLLLLLWLTQAHSGSFNSASTKSKIAHYSETNQKSALTIRLNVNPRC